MKKTLIIIVLISAITFFMQSCNKYAGVFTIKGQVCDAIDGKAIEGATVKFYEVDYQGESLSAVARTDKKGKYEVSFDTSYSNFSGKLEAGCAGYKTISFDIKVHVGTPQTFDIILVPNK